MSTQIPELFRTLRKKKQEEKSVLQAYPEERLADIISEVGFSCDRCAQCCTRVFNGHVHLLDDDAERVKLLDPLALEPAHPFDFCDQHGTLYVSGYTIRCKRDESQSCVFLEEGQCRIYDHRPRVCRIYPYMLHREADENGDIDWRQISGLDRHGNYHAPVSRDDALRWARETKAFEEAVLDHDIAFLTTLGSFYSRHGLRYVRKVYDDRLRAYRKGAAIIVLVFYKGHFMPWRCQNGKAALREEPENRGWLGKDGKVIFKGNRVNHRF